MPTNAVSFQSDKLFPHNDMAGAYLVIGGGDIYLELCREVEARLGSPVRSNPNVLVIETSVLLVAESRRIRAHMFQTGFGGGPKVVIIRAGQMMDGAQNALLKTIEDMEPRSTIAIVVQDEGVALPTIRSRSIILRPRVLNFSEADFLQFIADSVPDRLRRTESMTLALKTDDEKRAQRDVVRVWMASLVRVFDGLPCSRDREWARGAQVLMRAGDYLHDPAANLKLLLEDVVYSLPRVDKK